MIRRVIFAAAALLALAAPALATANPAFVFGGQSPSIRGVGEVLDYTEFSVGFQDAWLEPAWCAEHLTQAQAKAGEATARFGAFHPDASGKVPAAERVTPADYNRTGFDRGHACPAGDFGKDKPDSFTMANMMPQKPNLNRKVWAGIEAAVRGLAVRDGEVWIVTGPQIVAGAAKIGRGVAVPAMTWKAVYDPKLGAAAYACTNTDAPVCTQIAIAVLAVQIGGDPFPALPAAVKAKAAALPPPTKGG